jgi:hypothetical protein
LASNALISRTNWSRCTLARPSFANALSIQATVNPPTDMSGGGLFPLAFAKHRPKPS